MTETTYLKSTEVTTGAAQNAIINEAIRNIEASLFAVLDVDLTSGDATITSTTPTWEFLRYGIFDGTGHTVARTMTFPAPPATRIFHVLNSGTDDISVEIGSTAITVPSSSMYRFFADGTTDGLARIT